MKILNLGIFSKYSTLLCISIIITYLNVSNDFQSNLNTNIDQIIHSGLLYRGVIFYKIIDLASINFSIKNIIYTLSISIPILNFILFERINFQNKIAISLMYFGVVFLGQSFTLLKMVAAQTFLLTSLNLKNKLAYVFIIFTPLMHLQGFVVFFTYLWRFNRLFINILFLALGMLVYLNTNYLSEFSFLNAYFSNENFYTNNFQIHRFSIILIAFYIYSSIISNGVKNKISLMITPIIDLSLILSIFFISNPVVFNRVLEFTWMLIILYLGNISITTRPFKIAIYLFAFYSIFSGFLTIDNLIH